MTELDTSAVTVVMATFNGDVFLPAQLASLRAQTHRHVDLLVADDGSIDETPAILAEAVGTWPKGTARLLDGPGEGAAENFRALMAREDIETPYVALCDQDDVWDPDKLAVALKALEGARDGPALYCCRPRYIGTDGAFLRDPRAFSGPFGFANALVQNVAAGNTIVLNRRAFEIVSESCRRTGCVAHDWWCYLIVTGVGGRVIYDRTAHIGYRQHADNLVGANDTWGARLQRIGQLSAGRFADWSARNIAALQSCADLLSEESRERLSNFEAARKGIGPRQWRAFRASGVYRQTIYGQIALWIAFLTGRL